MGNDAFLSVLKPLNITGRHMLRILPMTNDALASWRLRATAIPDGDLKAQALSSIDHKRFHCQGGTVFAAWHPDEARHLVQFIVAFQTMCDYLDNLCDRTESLDESNFRTLHEAMLDAIRPGSSRFGTYYDRHPRKDDGGYLAGLVDCCRRTLARWPGYARVEPFVVRLVSLYIDLQVYKHGIPDDRVATLTKWFDRHRSGWPDARWWEFAAATGSTLGVFALVAEGARLQPTEDPAKLVNLYFPWIGGLHILLDYLIDQEEDRIEGDLNFVDFYRTSAEVYERLQWIVRCAQRKATRLREASFHHCVIEGLLGLYLTDRKVRDQNLKPLATTIVRQAGWRARIVYALCRLWRKTEPAPGPNTRC